MSGIFTPDLSDNRGVGRDESNPFESIEAPLFGSIARNISEFGEKEVGTAGVGDNLTKDDVGDALHGCED